ncbi:RIP metalloprotease RseP [Mesonia aestuariivivens]|uniref:Zinc metalloprotease n=1 Tax=Mesonia aestuariivivens TaxID=2796128 RepID=A0ABS6W3I2_9FLAO|nr:RIP metalloprotease RseP [Mesonia aestuariivivens]MBW2961693.1 RIP metalloprotease RseP [Mesonia aestuariivivens]
MSPFFIKALQLILSLSILIVLHEMGHFIPAKLFKTRVEKFFLFFDVKFALFKKKIGGTEYGLGWLPLGGYVKISGMIDESMDKEQMAKPPQPWEFRSKPAWQRLIIMIGGVTVNVILGFLIYMMVLFVWGSPELSNDDVKGGLSVSENVEEYGFRDGDLITKIDDEELDNILSMNGGLRINRDLMLRDVQTVEVLHQDGSKETIKVPENISSKLFKAGDMSPFAFEADPILNGVVEKSNAAKAGLKKGDRILAFNGDAIDSWQDFDQLKKENLDKEFILTVETENKERKEVVISVDSTGMVGASVNPYNRIKFNEREYSLAESLTKGVDYGYWTLHDYVAQFKFVFTKEGATQVGGFGAIGNMFAPIWDWYNFWMKTALLSIILAFMNILPIPALDGGHVMFLLYELITGRKPNDKFMEYAQMIGFFILIALVLFANGNDLYRYLFE